MSELLARIKLGTKNTKLIPWPGSDQMVMIRILSEHERQRASFDAEKYFQKEGIALHMGTVDEYETEKANQLLWKGLQDPATQEPLTKTMDEFRRTITRDERAQLISEYVTFEQDVSPSPEGMTEEAFEAFLADVKKNPSEALGNNSSSNILKKLITTLVNQLVTSQQPNGLSSLRSKKQS